MLIYLPEELQLARLMARDGLDEKQARSRMASQWPLLEKKKLADVVMDNQGTVADLEDKLSRWLTKFLTQQLG